ncbi:MAG TPA: hypothetical protein VMR31_11765 [Myxococcota bacterium]|nr:hypothetical protein [Myxococcota bacterium]
MRVLERAAAAALCAALAFAAPAGATLGTAYSDLVCRDPVDVANTFDFATSFIGITNCQKVCIQAFDICVRDVKAAASCQVAQASDWIASDSAVDCAGLKGADLSTCKQGWNLDLAAWKSSIMNTGNGTRIQGLAICQQKGNQCVLCSGH